LFEGRGLITTTVIVCYSATSLLGGYVSGTIYVRHDGRRWGRTALLTACLLPCCVFATVGVLNTIAVAHHSLEAVPFGTIVAVVLLWAVISVPLVRPGCCMPSRLRWPPDSSLRAVRARLNPGAPLQLPADQPVPSEAHPVAHPLARVVPASACAGTAGRPAALCFDLPGASLHHLVLLELQGTLEARHAQARLISQSPVWLMWRAMPRQQARIRRAVAAE